MPRRLPDYAIRNREVWTVSNANYTAASAHDSWAQEEITWGRWNTPESARLLRPGGELVFMRSTDLEMVCSADNERIGRQLLRPLKGMHRLDWTDDEVGASTEFHISHSELFQVLRRAGFEVLDFREL